MSIKQETNKQITSKTKQENLALLLSVAFQFPLWQMGSRPLEHLHPDSMAKVKKGYRWNHGCWVVMIWFTVSQRSHAGGGEKCLRDVVLLALKMKEGPCWKGYEGLLEAERSCGNRFVLGEDSQWHCVAHFQSWEQMKPCRLQMLSWRLFVMCVREN